jgi:uncharacterized small protein (DUF1192 family)
MDDDDLDPRARLAPSRALSCLSVSELRDYEQRLLGELETVRERISAKQGEMSAAESLFKPS